jgi:hypothetical protein
MLMPGWKMKNKKMRQPLRFARKEQPSQETSGERYVWYRYKLIRERVTLKRLSAESA